MESVTDHPELALVLSNCRPAHGAPRNGCPVCSAEAGRAIYCNQLKSGFGLERARAVIAERIAGRAGKPVPEAWRTREKPAPPKPPPADPGRPW